MDNHQAENLSDAELVKLSIQDDTFFAIIISRYKEHFFYFLKRSMSMPDDEIEDVIQNSFIKIYYHLNDFDQDLKFSSWAYRIIHNEAISELRRKHHSNVSLSPDFDIPDDLDVSEETDKILEKEKVALVLTAMDEKYREVLVLKFLEHRDYKEISDILEKPIGTVATLINRAKKIFKEKYNQYAE